jgi:hypothetical protein
MLGLVPEQPSYYLGKVLGTSCRTSAKKDGRFKVTPPPTGFEAMLLGNKVESHGASKVSSVPYRSSFAISNLGLLRTDAPASAEENHLRGLWFTQTPMPWGVAIYLDVVSYKTPKQRDGSEGESENLDLNPDQNELGITVSWLDGALDDDLMMRFITKLQSALTLIGGAGHEGTEQSSSLSRLSVRDIQSRM